MLMSLRSRIPVVLVVLGLAACGGKTVGEPGGNGGGGDNNGSSGGSTNSSSGGGSTGSGSTSGGNTGGSSGSTTTCVDVSASSFSTACKHDSDCTVVTTGQLCPDSCNCGDTPINQSSLAAYQAATSGITLGDCPCPYSGAARCIADQCTMCLPGQCDDGGTTTTTDASTGDAGTCIYVDPASFDTACVKDADCVVVTTGELCTDTCDCGDTPISASAEAQWQADVGGLVFGDCPCVAPPAPACVNDVCVVLPP